MADGLSRSWRADMWVPPHTRFLLLTVALPREGWAPGSLLLSLGGRGCECFDGWRRRTQRSHVTSELGPTRKKISRLCVLSLRVLVWGTPPPGCMEAPHRVGVRVKGVRPSAQQRSWQIASSTHHPCERTGAPGFWPQPLRLPAETPDVASKGRILVPTVDLLTECPTPRNCER